MNWTGFPYVLTAKNSYGGATNMINTSDFIKSKNIEIKWEAPILGGNPEKHAGHTGIFKKYGYPQQRNYIAAYTNNILKRSLCRKITD